MCSPSLKQQPLFTTSSIAFSPASRSWWITQALSRAPKTYLPGQNGILLTSCSAESKSRAPLKRFHIPPSPNLHGCKHLKPQWRWCDLVLCSSLSFGWRASEQRTQNHEARAQKLGQSSSRCPSFSTCRTPQRSCVCFHISIHVYQRGYYMGTGCLLKNFSVCVSLRLFRVIPSERRQIKRRSQSDTRVWCLQPSFCRTNSKLRHFSLAFTLQPCLHRSCTPISSFHETTLSQEFDRKYLWQRLRSVCLQTRRSLYWRMQGLVTALYRKFPLRYPSGR